MSRVLSRRILCLVIDFAMMNTATWWTPRSQCPEWKDGGQVAVLLFYYCVLLGLWLVIIAFYFTCAILQQLISFFLFFSLHHLHVGAASIGKGISGMLFSRFSRSNSQPSVSLGLDGGTNTEEEEQKRAESQSAYGLSTLTRPTSPTPDTSREFAHLSTTQTQTLVQSWRVISLRLCLFCSGAGTTHRLWAQRRSGGESLLVSCYLTHRLLVLTRHSTLPVDFHIQADVTFSSERGKDEWNADWISSLTSPHTLEWLNGVFFHFLEQDTTTDLIHLFLMRTNGLKTTFPLCPCYLDIFLSTWKPLLKKNNVIPRLFCF